MKVLEVRNVHDALPEAIRLITIEGIARDSRNGPVLQYPTPVTTVYQNPLERVIFHPERDANPFFHLYESLWMLAGRRDVAGPRRYAANMENYSDDGQVFHGAYGHRWRKWFMEKPTPDGCEGDIDQLEIIASALMKDSTDRRCVLQMWDAGWDLGQFGKDFPCNTIATFQISTEGNLDLCLFCRSNDIVWGAYGANAVHFSFLLEYMAHWIGVPMGRFYQTSVNWHGYVNVLEKVRVLADTYVTTGYNNPYGQDIPTVHAFRMGHELTHDQVDFRITRLLEAADHGFPDISDLFCAEENTFWVAAYRLLKAHWLFKTMPSEARINAALDELLLANQNCDWIVAGREWLERRRK